MHSKLLKLDRVHKREYLFSFLSFFIPFFFVLAAFIIQEVHPFGDKMILTVDLYHQYAPFVAELRDKILSGESLFFSWNIGLGTNFWAIFANYAASPLNLLMLFFPDKFIADGIALITCIRAGLTGLFMGYLLKDIDGGKRKDIISVIFPSFYALCGWILSYFWNIMWFDSVMLLPLIVLGLRKLIKEKKPLLYLVSLFLAIWSNYYVAYFLCIFLVLYFPVTLITVETKLTWKKAWESIWRFGLFSALAGGISAALVYPTYAALGQSSALGDTFPTDWALTQDAFDFFGRFFIGSNPNIRDGMANVYSGILVILLVPLFFICKKISFKEKLGYGILVILMYFSFSSKVLNFIWHGFHYPNQIPYREAFILSFLLVIMGYRVIRNLRSFSLVEITGVGAMAISYLILYEKLIVDGEPNSALYISAFFVIAYVVILRMISINKVSAERQRIFLCTAILVELSIASCLTIGTVSMNEGFTGWDFYAKLNQETREIVEADEASGEDDFTRAEMYPAYISNETALYHVKGMSVFSSTADESFIQFMKSIGFHNNGINGTRNFGMTDVTADLLGIDYFIDVSGGSPIPTGLTSVETNSSVEAYKNEDALSVGYMVSSDVLSFETNNLDNPFQTTNTFVSFLGESLFPVYITQPVSIGDCVNSEFTSGDQDQGYQFNVLSDSENVELNVYPSSSDDGVHNYLYVQANVGTTVVVSGTDLDTGETYSTSQDTRTMQIIDIGEYSADEGQSVKITLSGATGTITVRCASISDDYYSMILPELSDEQLSITSYDTTHLNGTITAKEDGVMLLTVPFDNGWTATVDGQETEISSIGDAIMGISLSAGEHEVSLSYRPAGFILGLAISIISLVIAIAFFVVSKLFSNKREKEKAAETSSFDVIDLHIDEESDGEIPNDFVIPEWRRTREQSVIREPIEVPGDSVEERDKNIEIIEETEKAESINRDSEINNQAGENVDGKE